MFLQDQLPDALTQQLEALPPELQQVLADMQGLANAGAAEHGLLDIQQTSKNDRRVAADQHAYRAQAVSVTPQWPQPCRCIVGSG
jgi:hypothetical protein